MVISEAKKPGATPAKAPSDGSKKRRQGGDFLMTDAAQDVFCRERFSEEQREIERMVREVAIDRIRPHRDELATHNEKLTRSLLREVGELGLLGVDVPEAYGGIELDKTTAALVVEALTLSGAASWIVPFSAHTGIGTLPLVFFGSEKQKEKYLPKLASGEHLAAYSLTETDAGSDALGLKATARLSEDESEWILDGSKIYVTNGGWADLFTVFAKIDGKKLSAFLVERGTPGLEIGPEEKKMGIKGSSTVSLFLEDARIPKDNLLGRPGDGGAIALNILNIGRFKLGAGDLGACKWATDIATEYALERRQFGQPIAFFEAIRKKLAEMVVATYVLDSVIYRTVGLMDERIDTLDPEAPDFNRQTMAALEEFAIESSISKILGSETLFRISDQGIQVFGGNGFSEEYPLAAVFRDTRIDRIFEGTNEINRMVIYGYFLKKALMEELPLRDAARGWLETPAAGNGFLAWELEALERSRRLAARLYHEAISLYGQDLRNTQVVGEDLADLAISYFGASSAINRIRQLGEAAATDSGYAALARLVMARHLEETSRLAYRLRPTLLASGFSAKLRDPFDNELAHLALPFDPVLEIQRLSDDLYHHGRYRFG